MATTVILARKNIIYAVSPDLIGSAGVPNAQVIFHFRHALAKVTVKMSSTNEDLSVRVTNVVLTNLMTKGNFSFPPESTSDILAEGNVGNGLTRIHLSAISCTYPEIRMM